MANTVILVGRLVKDCELKTSQNGTQFVNFTMAVPRKFKAKDGSTLTDFPNCTAYGKTAEVISKYIKKGQRFLAEGEVRTSKYEKDEQTVYSTTIHINNVEFLEPKKEVSEPQENSEIPPELFEDFSEAPPF